MYKTFSRSIDVKRYFHGISDVENRQGGGGEPARLSVHYAVPNV